MEVSDKLYPSVPCRSPETIEKPGQMEFRIIHILPIMLFGECDFGGPNGFLISNGFLLLNWTESLGSSAPSPRADRMHSIHATIGSRDLAQAVRTRSLKSRVLSQFVLVFLLHLGGTARWESFPTHSCMHLPACLLAVAKAWSARTSRMLGILGWSARQGRQKAGDRERWLWGAGEQKEAAGLQCEVGSESAPGY